MLKSLICSALVCLALSQADAQTLTMPPEIQKAFDNGTRSMSGKPGKNYWENHGRYHIAITVAPPNTLIRGTEQITYVNNSPDALNSLDMKLIENVHRGAGRGGAADTAAGVKVDAFMVNGTKAAWDNNEATTTNYMVNLAKPLMPHDSIKLDISWHYNLSKGAGARV